MNIMKKHGALGTLLSGSGSAVFGIFDDTKAAKDAEKQLKDTGADAFLCVPV